MRVLACVAMPMPWRGALRPALQAWGLGVCGWWGCVCCVGTLGHEIQKGSLSKSHMKRGVLSPYPAGIASDFVDTCSFAPPRSFPTSRACGAYMPTQGTPQLRGRKCMKQGGTLAWRSLCLGLVKEANGASQSSASKPLIIDANTRTKALAHTPTHDTHTHTQASLPPHSVPAP